MKHNRKPLAVLLAMLCVLCCAACCFAVLATDEDATEHTHDYVATVTVKPTCEDAGLLRYVCNCGAIDESRDTVVPPAGHSWGPWVTLKEATVDEEGLKERTCLTDPSHKEQKVIEKEEPSPISAFLQRIMARIKALYDRIISLFYRD